ncbi:MAG: hypothetical protein IKZ47_00305 [Clostridia bacterium]|nr:hypothetical protein [Clostridia bacterium]
MIKNIKVDIVYFMTATDFEFEFNLGSCCHMRLLNDKAKDKKTFVNSLARAVSRSQIIICCGPLFGEDGLIATAAAAISHGLKTVDNAAYGISSQSSVQIIDGGVPLVTPEGYFGGCVIESGNQSIILLTENRTVRKSIMKTLIHPYIEDMSIMQSAEKIAAHKPEAPVRATIPPVITEAAPAAADTAAPLVDTPDAAEEQTELPAEDAATEPAEDTAEEKVIETAAEQSEEPAEEPVEEEPVQQELFAESQTPQEEKYEAETASQEAPNEASQEESPENNSVHNIEFDYFDDDESGKDDPAAGSPQPEISPSEELFVQDEEEEIPKSTKSNVLILIVAAILVVVIIALTYFLIYLPLKEGKTPAEYLYGIFNTSARIGIFKR